MKLASSASRSIIHNHAALLPIFVMEYEVSRSLTDDYHKYSADVCNAVACGVLGALYYFIFYSRSQCVSGRRGAGGRRLLDSGSGGLSTSHDAGGPTADRAASTHIFMFKKSWSESSSFELLVVPEFLGRSAAPDEQQGASWTASWRFIINGRSRPSVDIVYRPIHCAKQNSFSIRYLLTFQTVSEYICRFLAENYSDGGEWGISVRGEKRDSILLLAVPRYRLNTYGRRAFSVAGPYSLELSSAFHPGPDHQCRVFQTFA